MVGNGCREELSMKFIGIAFMALGLVYSIQPAGAQALPGWRISEICARDSAEGQCRLYEAVAHQRVAASWDLLPREWRQSCLNSIRAPLEPSWRILSDCMDSKIRLSIMQRKTKEEAVELQKLEALLARRKAEAEAAARKAAAEAEAKRKAEEEARRKAEAEAAARKAAAEAETKRKAEEEAQRKAEAEAAARKAAAEAETKRKAEEEARRKAEAEAAARKAAAEAEAKRKAEEEAQRKAEAEVAARKAAAEAEAKRKAEEEAQRKAEAEVAARKAAAEAEAKRKAEVTACQDKLREIASKDGITFKTNGTEIDKRVLATLDELVQTAKSCANVVITVEGHTDSTGSEEANKRVSQRRAQAVVDYFIGAGLDANYVKAVGYGNTRPIATNDTARGRAQNRRIQFTVR
jgi:outer membrane protein OmpA-like peptidoglycan-associated protein